MTKDEIIELAKQAGFVDYELDDGTTDAFDKRYETFAKLIAKHEPKIDLGKYAGTYGGYTTPEPSEGYLQKAYRLANELRSHLSIAPPQRKWVGLTYEEKHAIRYSHMTSAEFIEVIEAKLKQKNGYAEEKNTRGQE